MSWQPYVDNNLIGTKQVSAAAIVGFNGSQWAASPGFTVGPQEVSALVKGFSDPSGLQAGGVTVNKVKYMYIVSDDRVVVGKKGATGVIAVKTKQAIIVGQYGDGIQPGACRKIVEGLADYLISQSY
eukprot:NODE_2489_length_560_cov_77.891455_g2439_i0.p1 GENE.NODE_2489_length_560_cov_77.891455_g2439_i0~~NODE_2489_length_560_cov_77.891455_g2439_i0.p1  ORF type:complete len:127 (-),score=32.99 NODE_2489_length_560_cov_77.891455_g2439_i0:71-451(-)